MLKILNIYSEQNLCEYRFIWYWKDNLKSRVFGSWYKQMLMLPKIIEENDEDKT